jgi:16S rRNA (cytosine1402-N4)-methyltransferase
MWKINLKKLKMHKPVLLKEVLSALNPKNGGVYVDATFGYGGYTEAILNSANCKVIGIDRDLTALNRANEIKEKFFNRFDFFNSPFSLINQVLNGLKVDGIVADLGVSSMQVDNSERGFSFLKEAKLDMRMGLGAKCSAYEVINNYSEPELREMIFKYGEERLAKKIANFIVRERSLKPITTTVELSNIIVQAYGSEAKYIKIHPATKTFQAIRIFINNELEEVETLLDKSTNLLNKDGILAIVSFHSLEDSIVKDFFVQNSPKKEKINKYAHFSKEARVDVSEIKPFILASKGIIAPTMEEVQENVRSRSARLRFGIKTF